MSPAAPAPARSAAAVSALSDPAAGAAIASAAAVLHLPTVAAQAGPIADAAARERLTHRAYLAEVLTAECDDRDARRRIRRVNEAKFPRTKRLEDFDTTAVADLPPPRLAHLATGAWIDAGEPLVLLGDSGTGKTHCETPDGGLTGLLGAGVPESVPAAATDSKVSLTRWRHAAVSLLWICRRGRRHRPDPPSLA